MFIETNDREEKWDSLPGLLPFHQAVNSIESLQNTFA
jgi:hypothetical protein